MGAAQDLAKCVTEPKMHHHAPPPKRLGSKLSSEAIRMAQNPDRDEHGLRNLRAASHSRATKLDCGYDLCGAELRPDKIE